MRRVTVDRVGRLFRYVNALVLVCLVSGLSWLAGAMASARKALPDAASLDTYHPKLTTTIWSSRRGPDGTLLRDEVLGTIFTEDREHIDLRDVPDSVIHATVALEDHEFWAHRGVSARGILRAAKANLLRQRVAQGGSTITQQLARAVWLNKERSLRRKLKEALLALELERKFSKDEILEMYLNEIYYGHGAYGIRTAAKLYFGKEPRELTLGQAALLAGIPQRPQAFDPFLHPAEAKYRRTQVLAAMQRYAPYTGAAHRPPTQWGQPITAKQAQEAEAEQIQQHLKHLTERGLRIDQAPHFTQRVIQVLSDQFGEDAVRQGGWDVITTLDMRLQRAAEEELADHVRELRREGVLKRGQVNGTYLGQGALACIEVNTGRVVAMVGGVGPYRTHQYNRADPGCYPWGRQPGSSFKPYVYTVALKLGYGPNSTWSGVQDVSKPGPSGTWHPQNYTHGQEHSWTMTGALAYSVNLAAIHCIEKVGVDRAVEQAAELMNIPESRFSEHRYESLALGTVNLCPLEQASGYATFASGGLRYDRLYVDRIEDYQGRIVAEYRPRAQRVISREVAASMVEMLRAVVREGTGQNAALDNIPAAGKTGTTTKEWDVWWVGFTPALSCAVWIGNEDNQAMSGAVGGGTRCAPIWASFMRRAYGIGGYQGSFPEGPGVHGERVADEEAPETVKVCKESGKLATEFCPDTEEVPATDELRSGGKCDLHGPGSGPPTVQPVPGGTPPGEPSGAMVRVTVCVDSGMLAGPYCPRVRTIEARADALPHTTCVLHRRARSDGEPPSAPTGTGTEPPSTPAPKEPAATPGATEEGAATGPQEFPATPEPEGGAAKAPDRTVPRSPRYPAWPHGGPRRSGPR